MLESNNYFVFAKENKSRVILISVVGTSITILVTDGIYIYF